MVAHHDYSNIMYLVLFRCICDSYTLVCPHVRGDNPWALASGLSPVQRTNHGITILFPALSV